jgi:hypothetical protein
MINNYIESVIDKHQKEFGVYFNRTTRTEIERYVNKATYAFQLIYTSGGGSGNLVNEIKFLDHNLCVHEDILGSPGRVGNMWSYDGGQRYQWSEMETLIFDPSVIRNIKIESIL